MAGERIDAKYRTRLPHIETDENGVKWMVSEGWQKSRAPDFNGFKFEGEDAARRCERKAGYMIPSSGDYRTICATGSTPKSFSRTRA